MQHNTNNVWVYVSARKGQEYINVPESTLSALVKAARIGMVDHQGKPGNCSNCPCWGNREYQNCELYHLIQSMPCSVPEEFRLSDDICPYAINNTNIDDLDTMTI